jgi:hypothetical protein
VKFPLHLRTPSWAENGTVRYHGESLKTAPGSTIILNEKWSNSDRIEIDFPMAVRTESRFNNSVAVMRGPLYYSLRIEKEYRSVKLNYDNFGYKGSADWEILPLSPWNYGLVLDNIERPERGINVTVNPIGKYPFADRGDMVWSDASGSFVEWSAEAPVTITVRGVKIAGWGMKNNSADVPPISPVRPDQPAETITLVPYGAARLRITEFPYIDVKAMVPVIGQGSK